MRDEYDILEYKGYRTTMEYDADDDILVGKLLGINDIVAFHSTTIEEFKIIFHRVVDDYIDYCKEIGKQPEVTDDTDYLLSSKANYEHLKKSIEQFKNNETKLHDLIDE